MAPTVFNLHPNGDVVFDCKRDGPNPLHYHIRVSSMVVSSKCEMFSTLVSPHSRFREGSQLRAHGFVEIPLYEEDPVGILALLRIVMGQDRDDVLTRENMMPFAVAADRYRCVHNVVTPGFLEFWMNRNRASFASTREFWSEMLALAYLLRYQSVFNKACQGLYAEEEPQTESIHPELGLDHIFDYLDNPDHSTRHKLVCDQITALAEHFMHPPTNRCTPNCTFSEEYGQNLRHFLEQNKIFPLQEHQSIPELQRNIDRADWYDGMGLHKFQGCKGNISQRQKCPRMNWKYGYGWTQEQFRQAAAWDFQGLCLICARKGKASPLKPGRVCRH